ncbi:hypothetical protein D9M70_551530 [compost metagenome]
MVTTAARISSRVLASEARNASAAPWKRLCTPSGMPISCWVRSITATASPSDTPSARLNDRLTAGNWPMWLITSSALRSSTWARLDSGTWPPAPVATWICPSACGPMVSPLFDCSTTRYWLAWVKMVEICRWPKASYSASVMAETLTPRRPARSRSMFR